MTRVNTVRTILSASLIGLAACQPASPPKLPDVAVQTLSRSLTFADGVTKLTADQQRSVASLLQPIHASAVLDAYVAADTASKKAMKRARALRTVLLHDGVDNRHIHLSPPASADPHILMLTLRYALPVPPPSCPDWSKNSALDYEGTDSSNFGCAYQNNFIVQLANPEDYDHGHGTPAISPARDGAILQGYFSNASSGGAPGTSATASAGGTTTTTSSTP